MRQYSAMVVVAWTCIPSGRHRRAAVLHGAACLTPYVIETIVEDARRCGPGSRLDLVVPADAPEAGVTALFAALARLDGHGILVRRQRRPAAA